MASIRFRVLGKTNPKTIYLRLSISRNNVLERKTKYFIDSKNWDSKNGAPKVKDSPERANLKTSLVDLGNNVLKLYNSAVTNHTIIDSNWLKDQLNILNGDIPITETDHLINHIQYIIDNAHRIKKPNGTIGLSESRVKGYRTFKNTIIRFQNETNKQKPFIIKNVNTDFSDKFSNWLFDQKYSINYVGKNIDNLKAVCRHASKKGIEVSEQLEYISGFTENKTSDEVIILSEAEQSTIANLEIKNNALINAKNWLLLGCKLGQRYSDLIRVNPNLIRAENGIKVIELRQQKTGKLVAIPLLPEAIDIMENKMPYPISSQNFNDYIKTLCKMAGFNEPTKGSVYLETEAKNKNKPKTPGTYPKWQLTGTHICRRSFASNFYGKIPTPILINITGHSTEKMFLKYIGRSSLDNAHQMMEYFGKLQARENKEPILHVLKNAN